MDFLLDKVRGVSNTLGVPFHKLKTLLENNKVYPDIIPFILLGLLAKGSNLLGEVQFIQPYLKYITKHIQIPAKYITQFQSAFVDTRIFYDLVYFYILVSLAGLFLKLYQSFNRIESALIAPLTGFTMSAVVAYTGLLFGLTLTGGIDPENWSRPVLVTVFGPLIGCLVVNMVAHFLGEKRAGEKVRRFLPLWMQQRFDGIFLVFLSGALLAYGRQGIELLKKLSQ